jgi:selenocysteine lyase/cysteine desulfurase
VTAPAWDHARIAADTPAAASAVFLDSAGSSLPPIPVLDTVIGHLRREAEVGGYRAAEERAASQAGVKTSIGRLIGAPAASIALTDSATRSWAQVFLSIPLRAGDRILLSGVEYASNAVAVLHRAEAAGASVEVMPSDATGQIDLDALPAMLDDRVRLVSIVHVPTNSGLVNPVREVADLAHQHGAFVLLDACQSMGQLAMDVGTLDVDALSATGRKWLRGPRGTGFLYVRPSLIRTLVPPVVDLHSLGAAVDYLLGLGPDEVEKAVAAGADRLRSALGETPGVQVRDRGARQCGIVTFTVGGVAPEAVRDELARHRITVTISRRASTLFDMDARGLPAVVRASPHYFVRPDQLDAAAAAVATLARRA